MYFFVSGDPVPQGRPRAFRRGDHIGFYDPKESKKWKSQIADEVALKMKRMGDLPLEGPLSLRVEFFLQKPKTCRRELPSVRPDLDNLVKAVKDALKGVTWKDDSQIVELHCTKEYVGIPGRLYPGVSIEVYEYDKKS